MAGELTQGVTVMFNLYRTSQLLFPGEKILEDAKQFSFKFLSEKRSANKLLDKWIIAKDLPSEVLYLCMYHLISIMSTITKLNVTVFAILYQN